jgi:hypothetical protein
MVSTVPERVTVFELFDLLRPAGRGSGRYGEQGLHDGQEERPGGTPAVERTMTATVAAIDKDAPSITFVGPNGWRYSRRVVDPEVLDKLKVGDQVDITWNTNVTVAVE